MDTFRALVVQDFGGVAVKDGDDGAGEVGGSVIGIHVCLELRPCGDSETNEREHRAMGSWSDKGACRGGVL